MYKIYLHFNIYKPKRAKRENRSNFQEYSEKMEGIISKKQKAAVKQPFAEVLGYFQKYRLSVGVLNYWLTSCHPCPVLRLQQELLLSFRRLHILW